MPMASEIDTWVDAPRRLTRNSTEPAPGVMRVDGSKVDFSQARMSLLDDDYAVRVIEGSRLTTLAAAQAAIVSALHLPISAATNLDALVDALRDLDLWWPRTRRIALLWRDADVLEQADPAGFAELVDILAIAHDELWRADKEPGTEGDEHDRILRVTLLPSDSTAAPVDPTAPAIQ